MKERNRNYLMYLEDIITSIDRIAEYIDGLSFDEFKKDYKTVDAVIRNFEVIGEAAKNLPFEIRSKYEDVPWDEMYLLRNKVSHEYFGIDYEMVWEIAKKNLPKNIEDFRKIIEKEK